MQFGFRDEGTVLRAGGPDFRCVYVADKPILKRDPRDRVTIAIEADHLSNDELSLWERTQRGNDYREWCIPAARLNAGVRRFVE